MGGLGPSHPCSSLVPTSLRGQRVCMDCPSSRQGTWVSRGRQRVLWEHSRSGSGASFLLLPRCRGNSFFLVRLSGYNRMPH